jgi:hypothetical protein
VYVPTERYLSGVSGSGRSDVWVVGDVGTILHWDGTAWTQVPGPNNGSTFLYDVAALSATDAWAETIGSYKRRIAPIGVEEETSPDGYPETLYVCKLAVSGGF